MLTYTSGGSFLPTEAMMTIGAIEYRKAIRRWSKTYDAACAAFNRGDDLGKALPIFTKRLPVSDFLLNGVSIRDEQYAPIWASINLGRGALFLGMGRGKTFIGGYVANYLQRYGKIKDCFPNNKALIVCPKNVVGEWESQIPSYFDCTVSSFPENPDADTDIVVTNYEQVRKLVPRRDEFKILILDESQRAKNLETQTFEALSDFVDMEIFHRFVLSGTPILNKPDDSFSQLSLVNPYAFGCSYEGMQQMFFKSSWIKGKGGKGFPKVTFRKGHEEHFNRILNRNSMIQTSTSEDVDIEIIYERCALSTKQASMLAHVAKGYITLESTTDLRKSVPATASQTLLKNELSKELQISSGFMMAGDKIIKFESPKLTKVWDILHAHPKEQFIIWTYFRATTQRLTNAIEGSAAIYGGCTKEQREKALADFKSGKLRVLVMQIRSGNSGLNLQHCTKQIFVESDWTPANIEQAIARSARSGQLHKVTVWMLHTIGTADFTIMSALVAKKKVSKAVMSTYVSKQLRKAQLGTIKARAV